MCKSCHQGLSDQDIIDNLQESIDKGDSSFNEFNTTSLSHITIAMTGVNGEKARALAETIMNNFIKYVEAGGKTEGFVLERCPSIEKIKETMNKINELPRVTDAESQAKRRLEVFGARKHSYTDPESDSSSTTTPTTLPTIDTNISGNLSGCQII